jgi:SGNH domain (fused to AT3 domains)
MRHSRWRSRRDVFTFRRRGGNADARGERGGGSAAVEASTSVTVIPDDLTPRLEVANDDYERLPTDHCAGPIKVKDSASGECTYGDPSGTKTVVLFGDSHAGMWSTSLDMAGRRGGWRLRVFEQGGCPAPRITFFKDGVPNTGCNDFREAAIAAIVASKPDVVVVTSATLFQRIGKAVTDVANPEEWQAGLSAVLGDLKASGAKLVVLGDLPVLAQPAPECLAAHQQDVARCATPRKTALKNVYHEAEQAAAAANGATYVDPTPWFCAKICWPIIGRMLVYRNQFHITATYAAFLSGAVRAAIGPL